ncbi:MAG: DUF4919 domain-containing protein [Paramuribaculum sp.]|nr:DUF4919 domain-containing protein [Paramuribaculum sp.]
MYRLFLLILLITISGNDIFAQTPVNIDFDRIKREVPDLDEIRRETYDRSSPYYYPRLMKEFQSNDTVMKLEKYRRLYLGYMFQEDYNPYRESRLKERAKPVTGDYTKLTSQECDSIIKYAGLILRDNPFDLTQMESLISALKVRGHINLASIWQYKFNYILMAIVSTGTGVDEENAWYVTETEHEYVLLNKMGCTIIDHTYHEPYFEYLKVRTPQGFGGVYFNLEGLLSEYFRKFPDETDS